MEIDEEEISNSAIHKADVVLVPDEIDTNRKLKQKTENPLSGPVMNNPSIPQQHTIGSQNNGTYPIVNQPINQVQKIEDPVDRILAESHYTPIALRSDFSQQQAIPNFNLPGGGYTVQPAYRPPISGVTGTQMAYPGVQPVVPNYQQGHNPYQTGMAMQQYANGSLANPMIGNYQNPYQPMPPYRPSRPPVSGIKMY